MFKHPSEVRNQCLELYKSGVELKQITDQHKVNEVTLRRWVKREGLNLRKGYQYPTALKVECQKDSEGGMTCFQIADKYQIPARTIREWVRELKPAIAVSS